MTNIDSVFDELTFLAKIKKRPALFYGKPSLMSFRDQFFGMDYAFSFYCQESPFKYLNLFIEWYHEEIIQDSNGYSCWWNHILYTSGNNDELALESFFRTFEGYLKKTHNISLPEVE